MTRQFQWFPWNGSKRWLCPRLSEIFSVWDGQGRFIDPFCGGGSVSHTVKRKFPATRQLLSDANPWLMAVFEWQSTQARYEPPSNFADVEYWRALTDAHLVDLDLRFKATRFAVCLLTAWGNRWKTEADGRFTASSTPVNLRYCESTYLEGRLRKFFDVRWLSPTDLSVCRDWKVSIDEVRTGDLVYLDTPYPESLGYGNQWWSFADQLDVTDWVAEAVPRGISVVVSNMSTLERLYRRAGLSVEIVSGPTASRTKRPREEVLAWKVHDGSTG